MSTFQPSLHGSPKAPRKAGRRVTALSNPPMAWVYNGSVLKAKKEIQPEQKGSALMSLTSTTPTPLSDLQGLGAGQTTNFIVQYENTLPSLANVIANADALLPVLETEFAVTTGWFNTPGGKFGAGQQQVVNLNQPDTATGGGIREPGASNRG